MESSRLGTENPVDKRFRVKRDRMLRAAARCFNLKGYSGTSLKDVAAILGLLAALLTARLLNRFRLSNYVFYPPLVFLALTVIYTVLIGGLLIPF